MKTSNKLLLGLLLLSVVCIVTVNVLLKMRYDSNMNEAYPPGRTGITATDSMSVQTGKN